MIVWHTFFRAGIKDKSPQTILAVTVIPAVSSIGGKCTRPLSSECSIFYEIF